MRVLRLWRWHGRRRGARMAIAMLIVNALGDTINALARHDFRTLIGVPIAAALISYVWRISNLKA